LLHSPADIYNLFGDVFALKLYAPEEPLIDELVLDKRYENAMGNKVVYKYATPPTTWNLKGCVNKPVRIEHNCGSFLSPHKDFISPGVNEKYVRLNCHPGATHPHDCTYIIDGKIQHWRPGQWMVMNPNKTHYSMCFKDNITHYVADLDITDSETYNWFMEQIEFRENVTNRQGTK
jgi:hypothetical protein